MEYCAHWDWLIARFNPNIHVRISFTNMTLIERRLTAGFQGVAKLTENVSQVAEGLPSMQEVLALILTIIQRRYHGPSLRRQRQREHMPKGHPQLPVVSVASRNRKGNKETPFDDQRRKLGSEYWTLHLYWFVSWQSILIVDFKFCPVSPLFYNSREKIIEKLRDIWK